MFVISVTKKMYSSIPIYAALYLNSTRETFSTFYSTTFTLQL